MRALLLMMVLGLLPPASWAHRPSDAYLSLELDNGTVSGHWEIALRDLAVLVELDADQDQQLSWGELRAAQPALASLLRSSLALSSAEVPCPLAVTDLMINDHSDGPYAWFVLRASCPQAPQHLDVDYRLLAGIDPTHRGLLALTAGASTQTAVLAADGGPRRFGLKAPSPVQAVRDYLREGVWHIWIGYDHILFLLALLLPAVLSRRHGTWQAVDGLRPALWSVFGVVTAFTVAHSITLSLAALGWVQLPGNWVEAAIAVSVMVAALNNLWPLLHARWVMAFAFGLLHGFGFASVLGELGLPDGARLLALVAFNVGVELGQMAIVLVAVPLAYAVRRSAFYRVGVRVAGSLAVAVLAGFWLLQRTGVLPA